VNPHTRQRFYFTLFRATGLVSLGILAVVLISIIDLGAEVISYRFLTSMWINRDITAGGIYPAIIGSFYLGLGVALFSMPVGIASAIYLNEYAGRSFLIRMIRLAIRNLAGVPSIIYGLFGFAVFVQMLNLGTSLIAASLTLSGMTVPWIITTSEESLKAVPQSFRNGALALGATKWQVVRTNVLPYAASGMITGSIIGLARAMGETAPIIIVGATFYMRGLPDSPFDKFMALPYHLFILATQHAHPQAQTYAAGTALVLITLIFMMTSIVMVVRYRFRKRKDW
jgi:phosphate transport system permease protein